MSEKIILIFCANVQQVFFSLVRYLSVIFFLSFPGFSLSDELSELNGFTIDNTITRVGHDFSRYLGEYRTLNYSNSSSYNLVVHERPSARWGSLIWVTENRKTVYRQFIQPRSSDFKALAQKAARQIHDSISQKKITSLFADRFDLETDEF